MHTIKVEFLRSSLEIFVEDFVDSIYSRGPQTFYFEGHLTSPFFDGGCRVCQ